MKAVILAGGAGTRLAPISADIPKPLAPLPGGPVMEHIVKLLARHGFNDICAAVCHLSGRIEEYFGTGKRWGVSIRYSREQRPLGTAGAAKLCVDDRSSEPVLIISGDAVCDFDLTAALRFHREKKAAATVLLARDPAPLEYGLVLTNGAGKILRFTEKPGWQQVFGSMVNTGIYIIESRLFSLIPENTPYDFAKDLFAELLRKGLPVCGYAPQGYWRDIGSCESYLKAAKDMMAGNVKVTLPENIKTIPGVSIVEPSFIEEGAIIGEGSVIGPLAYISSGSRVGMNCKIKESVVCGAEVNDGCWIEGAVLCRGSKAGKYARMLEGSVLGAGAGLGSECILSENVRVWPNRSVEGGFVLRQNLVTGSLNSAPAFNGHSMIRGDREQINSRFCARLGSALHPDGTLGLSSDGSDTAHALMEALSAGARDRGTPCVMTDAQNCAEAAFSGALYGFSMTVFIEEDGGKVNLCFFGRNGVPLTRGEERSIESVLRLGEWHSGGCGALLKVSGVRRAHLCAARNAVPGDWGKLTSLQGPGEGLLDELFTAAEISEEGPGMGLGLSFSGRRLRGTMPDGQELDEGDMLLLVGSLLIKSGFRSFPLPEDAPHALRELCARYGVKNGYPSLFGESVLPLAAVDGLVAAALIGGALRSASPEELIRGLPLGGRARRDVPLNGARCEVLDGLCRLFGESADTENGLARRDSRGWVRIVPSSRRELLHILTEAASGEIARSLCDEYEELIRKFDQK